MKRTRSQNVIRNMWVGTLFQMISLILGFVSRTIFIKILGSEYLGLNSLFTNVLTILSFAELGIGSAIIYSMYKPLAEEDNSKLKKLVNFYKETYFKIALIMILVGLILTPFIPYIINETPKISENIYLIYIIFLIDTSVSYFFSYRTSIITADQKNYIIIVYTYIFRIVQIILQLTLLYFTHNYLLYLFLQVFNTIFTQWFLSRKSKKMYPLIKDIKGEKLEEKEKKNILKNVKALFANKFGSVILNGTDSIIISKYLGLVPLGLYSNYYLITSAITQIIAQILNAFTSSVGNLLAKESIEKEKKVFNQLFYFTGFVYCVIGISLYLVFNDFIVIWLGEEYLLSNFVVAMIVGHLCVNGMQFATFTYRNASGEFDHLKYAPIVAAIVNIVLSIWLAKPLGLGGIFLATIVSRIISSGWIDPMVVYKYVFKSSVWDYVVRYFKMLIVFIICFVLAYFGSKFIVVDSILLFIVKGFITVFITSLGYILLTFRSEEFIGIKNALLFMIRKK